MDWQDYKEMNGQIGNLKVWWNVESAIWMIVTQVLTIEFFQFCYMFKKLFIINCWWGKYYEGSPTGQHPNILGEPFTVWFQSTTPRLPFSPQFAPFVLVKWNELTSPNALHTLLLPRFCHPFSLPRTFFHYFLIWQMSTCF